MSRITHLRAALAALPLLAAALGLAASSPALAQSRTMTPAEGRHEPYSGRVPLCDDPRVTAQIQKRFVHRETAYWQSGLEIQRITKIRETGLRTAGLDLIPRRYCQGWAQMNDRRERRVTYWIGEELGFIGGFGFLTRLGADRGFGVEWCIQGLDHHRAFEPTCRTAGP
ncbi:MAG: hypothetical protein FJX29_14650 [Alphaproteobacteria bacterium]|nr:hypothetical protein [Alphaproteobacteria bacterium]